MPICAPRRQTEKSAIVGLCACRGEAVLVLPEGHGEAAESFCHDGYLEVTHFNSTFIFLGIPGLISSYPPHWNVLHSLLMC